MSHTRPLSQWPEKEPGSRHLNYASQIQYFFKEVEVKGHLAVNTYAINLLNPRNKPYEWYNVPSHLQRFLRVIFWIQWSYGYSFLKKTHNKKLLQSYIIYMETIVDALWLALERNRLDNWLREVATPWCVIQRKTSFHSKEALEIAIRRGDLNIEELAGEITDWDSEADLLVDVGFPGSMWFNDELELRLDMLPMQEIGSIMNLLINDLGREEAYVKRCLEEQNHMDVDLPIPPRHIRKCKVTKSKKTNIEKGEEKARSSFVQAWNS